MLMFTHLFNTEKRIAVALVEPILFQAQRMIKYRSGKHVVILQFDGGRNYRHKWANMPRYERIQAC